MYKKLLLITFVSVCLNHSMQAGDKVNWSGLTLNQGMAFLGVAGMAGFGLTISLRALREDKGEWSKTTTIGTGVSTLALAFVGAFTFYAFKNLPARLKALGEVLK